ncbi:MAG TPA: P1 family peptidase [Nocardioidaceae bacterium]|nr:P1 family peptidase [Nocardioidaceae bacterium]
MSAQPPRRARDLGIVPGQLPPGPFNALTDVAGVRVGHATVTEGDDIRTGVTAIVPTALGPDRRTLPAAIDVGNGYGKLVGSTQVDELGVIETPILLTSTLSTYRVADALLDYVLSQPGNEGLTSVNIVVGETNDGYLSDIRRRVVTAEHVREALAAASSGPLDEGCVGAGTGTMALGYKAGIGSASRRVPVGGVDATLGALVQSNFGGRLTVLGVPASPDLLLEPTAEAVAPPGNSCMIVLATDAALDARQLGRLARRGVVALARVGSDYSHGSGDYAIAFSTAAELGPVADADLSPMFSAALECVEEAVLNSLLMATTTVGFRGRRAEALPHRALVERLAAAGVLTERP